MELDYDKLKKAGQIHKDVEEFLRREILITNNPPINLYKLSETIENKIRELGGKVAFPTGLSINNCAAHFTPNPEDIHLTLKSTDLIKIDYGVHIDGNIIDGAFSFSFSDEHDALIKTSKIATMEAIKLAKPGVCLSRIGSNTHDIIEKRGFKSVKDLCGHQIGLYRIHNGKVVPNIRFPKYCEKMKEGEVYAIETFPTTGTGNLWDDTNNCSHYMADYANNKHHRDYGTLAFCKRWLKESQTKELRKMLLKRIVKSYPPRYDTDKYSYVAQTEKTIYITKDGCEILN